MESVDQTSRGRSGTSGADDGNARQPVLFLVPGLMASELEVGGRPVWIDPQSLGQGDLERLDIRSSRVQATGLLRHIYDGAEAYFEEAYEVRSFAYDWRDSLLKAGQALAKEMRQALDETDGPVRVLAHSAGGLVALAMAHLEPDVWTRLTERPGSRMVLVGAPIRGTMVIPRILLGSAPIVQALARIDFQSDVREVVRVFSDFPGLLELLPEGGHDFFSHDFWVDLPDSEDREDWIFPSADALEHARKFRRMLERPLPHADRVSFVLGRGRRTPARLSIEDGEVVFEYSDRGDGITLWDSSIPDGVTPWYVDSGDDAHAKSAHGRLLHTSAYFPAFQELLETGATDRLATEAPVPVSDESLETVPDPGIDRFPDWTYLACLAIGWPPSRPPRENFQPLKATVVHADLAAARYPVVVGHYVGDGIANAEAALDYRVGGRLSRLHQLDIYPAEQGSCEVVLVSRDEDQRPGEPPTLFGAVVIGLGEVGSLSARSLTAAVRTGVIKYTEALRTAGREEVTGLSCLLIGTSDGSLTIESTIRACLRGVITANKELAAREMTPVLDAVEFVELYRDRALQALVALRSVCGEAEFAENQKPLVQAQTLRTDATGQRRVAFEPAEEWWGRLHVELAGDELRFTTPTSRARSEDSRVFIQADLIRRLLWRARDRKAVDEETPSALFELLVSNELKAMIGDRGDLVLVLDDGAAQFPWELLIDRFRGSARPLSIGSGLIRSLRVEVTPPLEVARDDTVFVVGDPPSYWPALPGAQKEALEVASHFESAGWDVTTQIHPRDEVSAASVLRSLMSRRYRILHLAGHGDFQKGKPTRTGMIIGSRKLSSQDADGEVRHELQLLRPHEVLQMPAVPELVFINCCHLGRQEGAGQYLRDRPLLASNLASQFIKNGVRAVVAAGWEVGDTSAKLFSQQFYRKMLAGSTFGDAVTEARQHVYSSRRLRDNTWGAFQCYGDPGFRLEIRDGRGPSFRSRFLDTEQLLAELDNVISRSKVRTENSQRREKQLKAHLEVIQQRLRRDQRRNGAVLARLARAWGELADRDRAIDLYERARQTASSGVTLTDLEQLANLRARRAAGPFVGGKKPRGVDRESATADIRQSIDEIEHLLDVAATTERLSLLASTYKRLALATGSSRERAEAVSMMTSYYARAVELDPDDPYPLLNALGGIVLMGGPWKNPPRTLKDSGLATSAEFEFALERAQSLAEQKEASSKNFWDRIHVKDLALVRGLASGGLAQPEQVKRIARGYWGLWHLYGSPGALDSVKDQVGFLAMVIKGSRGQALSHLKEQVAGLESLQALLSKPPKMGD